MGANKARLPLPAKFSMLVVDDAVRAGSEETGRFAMEPRGCGVYVQVAERFQHGDKDVEELTRRGLRGYFRTGGCDECISIDVAQVEADVVFAPPGWMSRTSRSGFSR